ncbi:hypothetical protein AALA13_00695 [Lachnospiraceae bacterium 50-23]|jgi:hypothetical protein|nr:hypothetical protein [Dorea sp.]
MKIEKGQPGYIKARKLKYLVWAIGEFAVVAVLVIVGYLKTGSKLNLFTVIAVVGCLPASKMLVEFITMAPHKGIEPEKFAEIEEKAGLITRIYDTVITGNGKVMPVDAFVISGRTICGYAGSPKANEAETARYIKEMLQNSHVDKVTVKIFCDYVAFLSRAEGMNNIATVESGGEGNREAKIKQLILSTSM